MDNKNKIYVAKLGKTVGLRGDMKIYLDTDFPEQFKKDATFTTNKKLTLKIKSFNSSNSTVKFENYEDIDLAKKLINQQLFTTLEKTRELCKLNENEFFWFDLIDCEIIENNVSLGIVEQVHRYPSSDYLEVKTNKDLVNKEDLPKTFLIPYLHDRYIKNIDIKQKTITTIDCFDILENS